RSPVPLLPLAPTRARIGSTYLPVPVGARLRPMTRAQLLEFVANPANLRPAAYATNGHAEIVVGNFGAPRWGGRNAGTARALADPTVTSTEAGRSIVQNFAAFRDRG